MDYLDLEAPGLTAGNVEKIAALFPAAVTETRGADGKVKKAVNFEVLKQLLAPDGIGTPPGTSTSRETIWKC